MSYSIQIDPASGIARITLEGEFTPDDMREVLRQLAIEGEFVASKRLWDVRKATGDLTSSDMEQLAKAALSQDAGGPGMVAIVATDNFVFGMSRVFEVYRESRQVTVEVFRDIAAAQRWLEKDHHRSGDR